MRNIYQLFRPNQLSLPLIYFFYKLIKIVFENISFLFPPLRPINFSTLMIDKESDLLIYERLERGFEIYLPGKKCKSSIFEIEKINCL